MMAIPPDPSAIPAELRARRQWVRWRYVEKGRSKPAKVPFHPVENRMASTDDPSTWGTFEEATANVEGFSGVGYVFSEDDPFIGIDLDDCIQDGQFSRDAEEILSRIKTYAEVSPSLTGVKLIARGRVPDDILPVDGEGRKATGLKVPGFEIYQSRRYFTTTFRRLAGSPSECIEINGDLGWFIERFILPRKTTGQQPSSTPPGHQCEVPYPERLKRAAAYAAKMSPAVSEEAGGRQTLVACQHIVKGFCLRPQDALEILRPWNATCRPPWTERDLRHKIDEALTKGVTVRQHQHLGAPSPTEQTKPSDAVVSIEEVEVVEEDFPEPMAPAARYGLAGEFLDLVEEETEAAPEALLTTFLVMFGNAVCPSTPDEVGPHCRAGAEVHPPVEFLLQIAGSSKGRKGTGKNLVKRLFEDIEDPWVTRIRSGLSTGEGLLAEVRDAVVTRTPIHEGKGQSRKVVGYEDVVTDEGSPDRRLLDIEPEFARPLAAMDRERNTLSAVLREAWDRPRVMYVMTKNQLRATNASVSMIAHCTRDELTARVSSTDLVNGFVNRFLVVATRRTRFLPDGGSICEDRKQAFAAKLRQRLEKARATGLVRRDARAAAQWRQVYEELSSERPGLLGAITARAEAHVLRLSLIFALTDGADTINLAHQNAALAVWDFCERSAKYVFGAHTLGDPVADEILRALKTAPDGLDRTSLFGLFNRNTTAAAITRALELLARQGLAKGFRVKTEAPKPLEVWVHTKHCSDIGAFTEALIRSGKRVVRPAEEAA